MIKLWTCVHSRMQYICYLVQVLVGSNQGHIQSRPQTPLQHCKRKGGSFLQVCRISAGQSDWLMWQLCHLYRLPYRKHLALLITPLETSLAHLQFTEAQQETSKAWLLGESIATASPQCEDVLHSPDSPFLFGGGSGNKTRSYLAR